MEGLILIDKPKGWTSFDVVARVRSLIAKEASLKPSKVKVGHTGTLDPMATGLLVLLVGKKYTKEAMRLTKLDKIYEVQMQLGKTSPSFDTETEISDVNDIAPDMDKVLGTINGFKGKISQVPPVFSAIKVDGKRAYNLARKDIEVKLEPRMVEIYSIDNIQYKYPFITFDCEVSSGTYIRSLVRDIGEALNTGAVMTGLRRIKIGHFELSENTIPADKLDIEYIKNNLLLDIE